MNVKVEDNAREWFVYQLWRSRDGQLINATAPVRSSNRSYPMASRFPKHHDSRKVQISKSFCLSYQWNVRNLERPWYGLWNATLLHLTENFENMIVVPQFPLWFRPEDDESDVEDDEGATDGRSDGEDDLNLFLYKEERDPDELQSMQREELKIEEDQDAPCLELEEANITTDSLVTLPGDRAELFPDFVIIHLLAKRLPRNHPRFDRLSGLRITHQCCPVIMEIKRHPSRRLRGSDFRRALVPFLNQAKSDLAYQCYYFFEQYPHAESTIAMAAAGDYWTHLTVYRHHVPSPVGDFLDISTWDSLMNCRHEDSILSARLSCRFLRQWAVSKH